MHERNAETFCTVEDLERRRERLTLGVDPPLTEHRGRRPYDAPGDTYAR
jgi:hypothetical protein